MTTQPTPSTWTAKLGSFSKSVIGGASINFSTSGGDNCSTTCLMHPTHKGEGPNLGACYAVGCEKQKPSIRVSGERRERQGFAKTCLQLGDDLERRLAKGERIPWLRFSSFGSVPNRALSNLERQAFQRLVRLAIQSQAPVHFPVESEAKRKRFQALCDSVQPDAITVRVSSQTLTKAMADRRKGLACSVAFTDGETGRDRVANAQVWAAKHRKSHGAMVCPAIVSTVTRSKHKVKCGECKACSQANHMVIYPKH